MKSWSLLIAIVCQLFIQVSANADWDRFQAQQQWLTQEQLLQQPEVAWKIPLTGVGQSSPVTWADSIFVTSVNGPNKEALVVTAYAIESGEQQWQQQFANPTPQEATPYVSLAAPSPVIDAERLICFFEGGFLVALDHAGKVLWQRNLIEEFGPISSRHGLGASLEQSAQHVFVWVERDGEPYVLCLDKADGKTVWNQPGLGATSWSSPRLVPVEGGEQLVLSGIGKLAGLDPKSGEKLWEFDQISGNSTPTPFPVSKGKFLVGATTGQSGGEEGRAAESNGLMEIKKDSEGKWSAGYVWKARKATSSFGTPVTDESRAYFVNRTGVIFALDLKTGEESFVVRGSASTWSTPFVAQKQLLVFSKSGVADLVSLDTAEPQVESKPLIEVAPGGGPFSGPTVYAAVYHHGAFYIRIGSELLRLKNGTANP